MPLFCASHSFDPPRTSTPRERVPERDQILGTPPRPNPSPPRRRRTSFAMEEPDSKLEDLSPVTRDNGELSPEPNYSVEAAAAPAKTNSQEIHDYNDASEPGILSEIRDVDDQKADAEAMEEAKAGISNGEGNSSFTMRELLDEVKEENGPARSAATAANGGNADAGSPQSQDSLQQRYGHNDASMDLINNVTGMDEEGRSRQRILAFAAKRYASAIEKNPADHDAYYNWALVLQESADNVSQDSSSPSKDALLEEACKKYDEATRLCPALHDAYYNWAIAISDRAKMRGRTKEAEEFWKQATKNYEKAVQLNWNSPQALNNWGLALQELSAIVPVREKQTIVKTAINKFRAAIQLQFDFHRAIYNFGTVLYGLAEDTLRSGGSVSAKEVSPDELYSQSAIYIAAAHALKPNYSVYRSALRLVRSMLPLPYLKVGYLNAPSARNPIAPHSDWRRSQFVLNHEGLQQVSKGDKKLSESPSVRLRGSSGSIDRSFIKVDIQDIVSVSACADLTLPPGAGLCIDTIQGPVFLVADTWESLDGWLDALRLVYTIYARGKSDVLAGVITG